MSQQSKLRLVKYVPDDMELGYALAAPENELVRDPILISSALSLFFQWQEYRRGSIVLGKDQESIVSEISYDPDESEPTELYVTFQSSDLKFLETLVVHLEVFNVCYSFETRILAKTAGSETSQLVIAPPDSLWVRRGRGIPRVSLPEPIEAKWISEGNSPEPTDLKISQVGVRSMMAKIDRPIDPGVGRIVLGEDEFAASLMVPGNGKVIVVIDCETKIEFGRYFDFFSKYAFPTLKPKYKTDYRNLFEVYKDTGFFDKYVNVNNKEECDEYADRLMDTWKKIEAEHHNLSAEYVSVSESSGIVGASSLISAFRREGRPVWVITQLCSQAKPELFKNTFELYLWRTAYLFGVPEECDVTCWFDGNSRFLERLWTKFVQQSGRVSDVFWPVSIRLYSDTSTTNRLESKWNIEKLGDYDRLISNEDSYIAGAEPPYLNFGKLLDHVFSVPPDHMSSSRLMEIAQNLLEKSKEEGKRIRVTVSKTRESDFAGFEEIKLNRHCYIRKTDIGYLDSSIKHSLAVMERKHKRSVL